MSNSDVLARAVCKAYKTIRTEIRDDARALEGIARTLPQLADGTKRMILLRALRRLHEVVGGAASSDGVCFNMAKVMDSIFVCVSVLMVPPDVVVAGSSSSSRNDCTGGGDATYHEMLTRTAKVMMCHLIDDADIKDASSSACLTRLCQIISTASLDFGRFWVPLQVKHPELEDKDIDEMIDEMIVGLVEKDKVSSGFPSFIDTIKNGNDARVVILELCNHLIEKGSSKCLIHAVVMVLFKCIVVDDKERPRHGLDAPSVTELRDKRANGGSVSMIYHLLFEHFWTFVHPKCGMLAHMFEDANALGAYFGRGDTQREMKQVDFFLLVMMSCSSIKVKNGNGRQFDYICGMDMFWKRIKQ